MNKFVAALLLALMMSTQAFAESDAKRPEAESGKKLTKQQMRMKECNREAKEKKLRGAERKRFMKPCLSGKR
ncbi:MAG: hypothetical protein K2P57_08810 [Burkholderiales bacterium]|nr:hypothetical protein [Burkholderiales bacterium]